MVTETPYPNIAPPEPPKPRTPFEQTVASFQTEVQGLIKPGHTSTLEVLINLATGNPEVITNLSNQLQQHGLSSKITREQSLTLTQQAATITTFMELIQTAAEKAATISPTARLTSENLQTASEIAQIAVPCLRTIRDAEIIATVASNPQTEFDKFIAKLLDRANKIWPPLQTDQPTDIQLARAVQDKAILQTIEANIKACQQKKPEFALSHAYTLVLDLIRKAKAKVPAHQGALVELTNEALNIECALHWLNRLKTLADVQALYELPPFLRGRVTVEETQKIAGIYAVNHTLKALQGCSGFLGNQQLETKILFLTQLRDSLFQTPATQPPKIPLKKAV